AITPSMCLSDPGLLLPSPKGRANQFPYLIMLSVSCNLSKNLPRNYFPCLSAAPGACCFSTPFEPFTRLRGAKLGNLFRFAKTFFNLFFLSFASELLSSAGCKGKNFFSIRSNLFSIFFPAFSPRNASSFFAAGPLSEPGCKGKKSFGNRKLYFKFFFGRFSEENRLPKQPGRLFKHLPFSLTNPSLPNRDAKVTKVSRLASTG
ncbi:hypothetical protein, partial [Pontibacter cellulosilyticus]|uniref:hypothetical protein n=1 Tax=Pontibacter cellulosilyticus TaxID=1720253 RepID=UPI001C9AB9A0